MFYAFAEDLEGDPIFFWRFETIIYGFLKSRLESHSLVGEVFSDNALEHLLVCQDENLISECISFSSLLEKIKNRIFPDILLTSSRSESPFLKFYQLRFLDIIRNNPDFKISVEEWAKQFPIDKPLGS